MCGDSLLCRRTLNMQRLVNILRGDTLNDIMTAILVLLVIHYAPRIFF